MTYQTKVADDPRDPVKFRDPLTGSLFYRGLGNIYVDPEVITGLLARSIVKKHQEQIPKTTHPSHEAILNVTGTKIGPFIEGPYVQGKKSQIFFDAVLNVGTHGPFGYNDQEISEKMKPWQHLAGYKFAGTDFYTISSHGMPLQTELAQLLNETAEKAFGPKYMTKFSNSGTEANEDATKVAMYNKWIRLRQKLADDELLRDMKEQLGICQIRDDGLLSNYPMFVTAFDGAFHGRTGGSLSYTYSKLVHKEGIQAFQYVQHLPYNSSVNFEEAIDHRPIKKLIENWELADVIKSGKVPIDLLSMIIFEPVQGEGGYRIPSQEFLQKLNDFIMNYKNRGVVLVDDEVQAGMGRTGTVFAIEHYIEKNPNLTPDIITMAKALPVGVTIINKKLLRGWPGGKFSGTWSGGDVTSIAYGYYTLEKLRGYDPYLRTSYLENARIGGEQLREGIKRLSERINENHPKTITNIRGIGQMTAFDMPGSEIRDQYERELFLHGVHMIGTAENSMRIFGTVDQRPREREILLQAMEDAMKSLLEN